MDNKQWQILNLSYHEFIEDPVTIKAGKRRPPPYFEQAATLNVLARNKLVDMESCLDWGSGYGTLSSAMDKYYDIDINTYDRYMPPKKNGLTAKGLKQKKFNAVFSSAVFEHITDRKYLDEINSYVSDKGSLMFHTVVCENIPKDSEWFYLLPVHTAFHTNKSMQILMEQWGYKASIYCPLSKMWILLKNQSEKTEKLISAINLEFQFEYLYYKRGFMDYWK